MRRARYWLCGLLALPIGCDTFDTKQVENPVVGPPPPRMSREQHGFDQRDIIEEPGQAAAGGPRHGGIRPVSAGVAENDIGDNQVVATVNGSPIFAFEVLEQHAAALAQARERASRLEFQQLRRMLIQRDLKAHIEYRVLADALQSALTEEQREMLDGHINTVFEREVVERLKGQYGVHTKHELQLELNEQSTSLEDLRHAYIVQRMAKEYLASNVPAPREIGRPELVAYYREHSDEYAVPARVKWQQILIGYRDQGGKAQALELLTQAIEELKNGADFGDIAKKYSNGPTAAKGGHWNWTQKGSLANEAIEEALFVLPVGKISRVFEGEQAYQLVRVNAREKAGRVPFAEVQTEIKQRLERQAKEQVIRDTIDELVEAAVVETIFDTDFGTQPKAG